MSHLNFKCEFLILFSYLYLVSAQQQPMISNGALNQNIYQFIKSSQLTSKVFRIIKLKL